MKTVLVTKEGGRNAAQNILIGLLPLLMLVGSALAYPGGEDAREEYFQLCRALLPDFTRVVRWLTKYGNIPLYFVYAGILLYGIKNRRRSEIHFVLAYIAVLLLTLLIVDAAKIWIGRPRPGEPDDFISFSLRREQHSFPSNHVTETAFTALLLARYFNRLPATIAAALWIAVIGFTRLYLGQHHPTDLLGSALLGCLAVGLHSLITGSPRDGYPENGAAAVLSEPGGWETDDAVG